MNGVSSSTRNGKRKDGAYTNTMTMTRNSAYFHDNEVDGLSIGLTELFGDGINFQNHICDPGKLHCIHFCAPDCRPSGNFEKVGQCLNGRHQTRYAAVEKNLCNSCRCVFYVSAECRAR